MVRVLLLSATLMITLPVCAAEKAPLNETPEEKYIRLTTTHELDKRTGKPRVIRKCQWLDKTHMECVFTIIHP